MFRQRMTSGKLAIAIEKSNRMMAEDAIHEAGYMLRKFPSRSSGKTNRKFNKNEEAYIKQE
jgi:hypothetical protein